MKKNTSSLIFVLLFFTGITYVQGQDREDFVEEYLESQPQSLFNTQLGDDEVDLFLTGFWRTGLALGDRSKNSILQDYGFVPWNNQVALLMTLRYGENWFLDINLGDDLPASTLSLGWEDPEALGLTRVSAGNSDIGPKGRYGNLLLGESTNGFPGVYAGWQNIDQGSFWEAFVRLRTGSLVSERISLTSNDVYQSFSLNDFASGLVFQLPHTNISNLNIYVEGNGNVFDDLGRSYKRLQASDIGSFDPGTGVLTLKSRVTSNIFISYDCGGVSWDKVTGNVLFPTFNSLLGSYSLNVPGILFSIISGSSFRTEILDPLVNFSGKDPGTTIGGFISTIDGRATFKLHDPHVLGPFDMVGVYGGQNQNKQRLQGSAWIEGSPEYSIEALYEDGYWKLLADTSFPFSRLYPQLRFFQEGQTTSFPLDSNSISKKTIQFASTQFTTPIKGGTIQQGGLQHSLGRTPILGTLVLYRDGLLEPGFSYDPDKNIITLPWTPLPGEELELHYLVADRGGDSSNLELFAGLESPLLDTTILSHLGVLAEVPIQTESTSNSQGASLTINTGLQGGDARLRWQVQGSQQINIGDAGAIKQLLGFHEDSYHIILSEDVIGPSPPLYKIKEQRGSLYFRDFKSGNDYLPWNASTVPQSRPYANGEPMGPSLADGGLEPEIPGLGLYMNYSMDDSKDWVGARITLDPQAKDVITNSKRLRFWLRFEKTLGDLQVDLVLGDGGEDTDGNGQLAVGMGSGSGYAFVHDSDLTLRSGIRSSFSGNFGEDIDRDLYLDGPGGIHKVWSSTVTSSGLTEVVVPLTTAYAHALANGRGIYIIATKVQAGGASGTIILGGLVLEGTGNVTGPGLTLGETRVVSGEIAAQEELLLLQKFPDLGTFAQSSNAKLVQDQFSILDTRSITINLPTTDIRPWELLGFHLNTTVNIGELAIKGFDSKGNEIFWGTLDNLEPIQWSRIEINRSQKTIGLLSTNNEVMVTKQLSLGGGDPGSLRWLEITYIPLTFPGSILLDEVFLKSINNSFSGQVSANIDFNSTETLVSLLGVTILSNPTLSSTIRTGYNYVLGSPEFLVSTDYSADLGMSFLGLGLRGRIVGDQVGLSSFGHGILVPKETTGFLGFYDEFTFTPNQLNILHRSGLEIGRDGIPQLSVVLNQLRGLQGSSYGYISNLGLKTENILAFLEGTFSRQGSSEPTSYSGYGSAWIYSWKSMLQDLLNTSLRPTLGFSGNFNLTDTFLTPKISMVTNLVPQEGGGLSRFTLGSSLSMDIDAPNETWELGANYKTETSLLLNNHSVDFMSMIQLTWETLQNPDLMLLRVPIVSLFDPPRELQGTQTTSRSDLLSLGIQWSRSQSGTMIFGIPRSVEAAVSSTIDQDTFTQEKELWFQGSMFFSELNRFGLQSAQPVLNWYDQDAFSLTLKTKVLADTIPHWGSSLSGNATIKGIGGSLEKGGVSLAGSVATLKTIDDPGTIRFTTNHALTVVQDLFWFSKADLAWSWGTPIPFAWDPRPRHLRALEPSLHHKEYVSVSWMNGANVSSSNEKALDHISVIGSYISNPTGYGSYKGPIIEMAHETTLLFPTFAFISINARLGLTTAQGSSGDSFGLGLGWKLGLEGKLIF